MPFQKSIGLMPSRSLPGNPVSAIREQVFVPYQHLSDGTCEAGKFAYADTAEADAFGTASLKGTAGAMPLGIVMRVTDATIMDALAESTAVYPEGYPVQIIKRGQVYMEATGAATEGQAILCDPTTSTITYGTAGATNDTGWVVRLPQGVATVAQGDLIIAECYGLTVQASGS